MKGFSALLFVGSLACLSASASVTVDAAEKGTGSAPQDDNKTPRTCRCTREYAPQCGVDGTTYANPCLRECQDVILLHDGPCQPQGKGKNLRGSGEGTTDESEDKEDNEGAAEEGFELPEDDAENASGEEGEVNVDACPCPLNLLLNCGVDGKTYSNHCQRQCYGVELKHDGPCEGDEYLNPPILE